VQRADGSRNCKVARAVGDHARRRTARRLAPKLVAQIFASIIEIAKTGMTILLVEQNTRLALETAHRAHVLVTGEIVLSGACDELKADPRIKAAYLGEAL
jgi:branched-chain amino acid transport system ATP-binding protein